MNGSELHGNSAAADSQSINESTSVGCDRCSQSLYSNQNLTTVQNPLIETGSMASKLLLYSQQKYRELEKVNESQAEQLQELRAQLEASRNEAEQIQELRDELKAVRNASSLASTVDKRTGNNLSEKVTLVQTISQKVIKESQIILNESQKVQNESHHALQRDFPSTKKRGRPKNDTVTIKGTYTKEAHIDDSIQPSDESILVDFDIDIYTAHDETPKGVNSAQQTIDIILNKYSTSLKTVEEAESFIKFKSFEKASLIIFLLFTLKHDIWLSTDDTKKSQHKKTDSVRVVRTFECSHCGKSLAKLVFDSRRHQFVQLEMISVSHLCDLEDVIRHFGMLKRKAAEPKKKNRVFTQSMTDIFNITEKLDFDIQLLKLYMDISKTRTFYHRSSLESLIQCIILQENQIITSTTLKEHAKINIILEKVCNIFCYKLNLLDKSLIGSLNKLLCSDFNASIAIERIKKSLRHSIKFQALWPYSTETEFTRQSLLATLPVLELYDNDAVFFLDDNSIISTSKFQQNKLEAELLSLISSHKEGVRSCNMVETHDSEDPSDSFPTEEPPAYNIIEDETHEPFTIGELSNSIESIFVSSSKQIKCYKSQKIDFNVKSVNPDLLSKISKPLRERNEVTSIFFSQPLPYQFLQAKCVPVIAFDGTYLKVLQGKKNEHFKVLLVATLKLGNNTSVPLSYFICSSECFATWNTFMSTFELLHRDFLKSLGNFSITSDAEKGLKRAMSLVFRDHRYNFIPCTVHLLKNVLKYTTNISKKEEGKRVSLLTTLTQSITRDKVDQAKRELLEKFYAKHRSNKNKTYLLIKDQFSSFNRLDRIVATYEVFTSNQVESLNNVLRQIRQMNVVNLIISSLVYQQVRLRDCQQVFSPSSGTISKKSSGIQLTEIGSSLYSMVLSLSQLYSVHEIKTASEGKWSVKIDDHLKSNISKHDYLDLIKRYNTAMKRKPSYVQYRKVFYEELYHLEAIVSQAPDGQFACSVCKSDYKSFTYCVHITSVVTRINKVKLSVDLKKLFKEKERVTFPPLGTPHEFIHNSLIRDWRGSSECVVEFPENSAKIRQHIEDVRKLVCETKKSADEQTRDQGIRLKRYSDARDIMKSTKKRNLK